MHPVRVIWSDKDGEWSVGLGGLHKVFAHDPVLGLAVLRGLKEWEHGRHCAELWGQSRPYKTTSWAHLGEVGWLGCEDGALWRGMGGGEGREVNEEREGASTTTPPPPPLQKKQRQSPRPKAEAVRLGLGRRDRQPRLFLFVVLRRGRPPPQQEPPPPPKVKGVPAPKEKGREKKAEGGWERSGGGEEGRRGGGTPRSPRGNPRPCPIRGGVKVGTVTSVHTRKSGVVWVRYPKNPKLYEA